MSKVLFLVSPTLNSFVDKRKGTMGNRIDCATKHAGNAIVTHTIAGASLAGAAAIGRAVASKTPELAQSIATMNPVKKAFKYFAAAPIEKFLNGSQPTPSFTSVTSPSPE